LRRIESIIASTPSLSRLAVLQVFHDFGDAAFEHGMHVLGFLQFGLELAADRPVRLAQLLEFVLHRHRPAGILENQVARVGGDAAQGIDPDMAADAAKPGDRVVGIHGQAVQRERRFQPGPVEAADVHAQGEPVDADPDFAGTGVHANC
jgi:hypothetical protein